MSEQTKVVVRFGRRIASAIQEPGSWAGLPCENVEGGAVVQGGALQSALNSEHTTAVTVEAPSRRHGEGQVHAIAIAPDSPIEACNIHVANGQTYRVGVGAPFIGLIDDMRNIRVSPARGIPALYRWPAAVPTYAQFQTYARAWDMPDIESDDLENYDHAGVPGRTIALPKPPVKLLLLRGGAAALVASQARRSVYNAEMLFRTDAFSDTNGCHFVVITDGRRRVRVQAMQQALGFGSDGTASVQVFGVGSVKTSDYSAALNGIGDGRIDMATYDELLAPTALVSATPATSMNPTVFDYNGNPYFAFHVVVTSDIANARGNIVVDAWDE